MIQACATAAPLEPDSDGIRQAFDQPTRPFKSRRLTRVERLAHEQASTGFPGEAMAHQLHNLRVFLFAANAGSMARAAEQLFKAPSAVTRSITELERALGSALFLRQPRGITLTACGESVRQRATRIQEEILTAARPFLTPSPRGFSNSPHAVGTLLCNGRKLLLLTYLASLRNISLAAQKMGMTQAGASMALSRMEEVLGQALFHRRNDGMIATDSAEKLVLHARRIFAELRHMEAEVAAEPGQVRGNVVIGTTPLGRTGHITQAIAKAIADNPGLRITTVEGSYNHLVEILGKGEVDMVVGALRPSHQCHGLVTQPLFDDRLAILARADHPLAQKPSVDLTELVKERWVMPRANALARPMIEHAFEQAGATLPVVAIETGDVSIVRQLLQSTDMLAVTTPHPFAQDMTQGLVCELSVGPLGLVRQIGLIRRRGAVLNAACQLVIEAIQHGVRG
ncbi:LysR family transcriptional regulator [Novosphingobium umbonatum]|uniref:LysR family transcriptional regulator n=1 Tax=Novosphingobium umbonatum TaxID=1908524 RepID=A0A3S2UP37_9SPHN|nr:LysR family transcriptional regulator [Novosphingobium umbonatum]RVU03231.1 LysR family transcriptional regulator [Novosphingobium umbonatum]